MATAAFQSLDGASVTVSGPGVEKWPVSSSSVAIEGWMGRMILRCRSNTAAHMDHALMEGMQVEEEYELERGKVTISSGGLYDPVDFKYYGQQFGAIWNDGEVAVSTLVADQGKRWMLDYFSLVVPASNGRSASVRPLHQEDWRAEVLAEPAPRLLLSLPGIGPLEYVTPEAGRTMAKSSSRSKSIPVGQMHRFDRQRLSNRVLLETPSAWFLATAIDSSTEKALDVLTGLSALEWKA